MALKSWTFCGCSLVRDVFIETGTGEGGMVRSALEAVDKTMYSWQRFERIISYEVNQRLADNACERFGKKAFIVNADSRMMLKLPLDRSTPTTFWLDAHYCDGPRDEMPSDGCECPLLDELAAIFVARWQTPPLVLIDDAANFMHPWPKGLYKNCDESKWPSLREIAAQFPAEYGYTITLWDNILYCLPEGFFA